MTTRRGFVTGGLLGLAGCGSGEREAPRPSRTPGATSPSASPTPTRTPSPTPSRRRKPGTRDWRALAGTLDGRLLRPGDALYDRSHRLFDPRFDAIAPPAVVQARTSQDVAEAIRFAARFGLPAVPRSGGHSYVGASTSPTGVVVDVRLLDAIAIDGDRARIGAGAGLEPVFDRLGASGRLVPAGTCPTVGIAGLALGGGLGLGTRAYGLTSDHIEGVTIVTADGRVRRVDARSDPDLLWACRGGGGGTVGIVTEFSMRTRESPRIGIFRARWPWERAADLLRAWQRWIPTTGESAWANLHLDTDPDDVKAASIVGAAFDNDPGRHLEALTRLVGADPLVPSLQTDRRLAAMGGHDRTRFWGGGDVLPGPVGDRDIDGLVAAISHARRQGLKAAVIVDPLGGAVTRLAPTATAFPWREAFGTIQWYAEPGAGSAAAAARWVRAGHGVLRDTPTGSYVNYLESGRGDAKTYFGINTARLRQIKRRYDPDRVFRPPYRL